MKFKIIAYKPPTDKNIDYPDELKRARDLIATSCATLMQLHGIKSVKLNAALVGPVIQPEPSIELLEQEPPEPAAKVRTSIARQIAAIMVTYGLLEFEITPDDKEIEAMAARWATMLDGGI